MACLLLPQSDSTLDELLLFAKSIKMPPFPLFRIFNHSSILLSIRILLQPAWISVSFQSIQSFSLGTGFPFIQPFAQRDQLTIFYLRSSIDLIETTALIQSRPQDIPRITTPCDHAFQPRIMRPPRRFRHPTHHHRRSTVTTPGWIWW